MPKKKSAKTSARKVKEKTEVVETQGVEAEELSAETSAEKTIEKLKDTEGKFSVSSSDLPDALDRSAKVAKDAGESFDKMSEEILKEKHSFPVKVKKLHEDSKLPVRAHSTDAGLDLFAYEDFTLEMLERKLVGTGVAIQIPDGHVGFIKEKSGLANKGLEVKAGVIDQYRGEIEVLVKNPKGFAWKDGKRDGVGGKLSFKKGEKIAQMVIIPVNLGEVVEVDELDESDRGDNGFGSSGDE